MGKKLDISRRTIDQMILEIDVNNDGSITEDEWID